VTLRVYDVSGAHVRTVVDETLNAGEYVRAWDRRDDAGRDVANGIYVARLVTGAGVVTQKLVNLR
jgi:flagellar hook assembly protein FlgD